MRDNKEMNNKSAPVPDQEKKLEWTCPEITPLAIKASKSNAGPGPDAGPELGDTNS